MVIATNKRALFDYEIIEKYEAGLVLFGFETKAAKKGRFNLKGSHIVIHQNEAWLLNSQISPYQPKNTPDDYNPTRSRKLLLHRKEINALIGKSKEKNLTLVPIQAYTRHDRIKLEFGLARGKKKYDKRESIKKRENKRKIERSLKGDARHR